MEAIFTGIFTSLTSMKIELVKGLQSILGILQKITSIHVVFPGGTELPDLGMCW